MALLDAVGISCGQPTHLQALSFMSCRHGVEVSAKCRATRGSSADARALRDASAFLFCAVPEILTATSNLQKIDYSQATTLEGRQRVQDRGETEQDCLVSRVPRPVNLVAADGGTRRWLQILDPGPLDLRSIAMLLPAAVAAHHGLLAGNGVAAACLPIALPFSLSQVSTDTWTASKRARAFHRTVTLCVWLQGGFTVFKFARGDLVGGVYEGIQAMMGAFAIQPDGQSMFPTYMICCGFNGLLGLLQVFQMYQGAALTSIPVMAVAPPCVALTGAFCSWQFCKEMAAIASGYTGAGSDDTCFVRMMSADWWPSFLSPSLPPGGSPSPGSNSRPGGGAPEWPGSSQGFSAFEGDGHRLGSGT